LIKKNSLNSLIKTHKNFFIFFKFFFFKIETCSSYSDCDTCAPRTYDSDGFGLCLDCIDNCLECEDDTTCETCIDNMAFNATFEGCQCTGSLYYNNATSSC
jgi:hypothetical protein